MIYISSACVKNNNIAEIIGLLAENGIKSIELSGGTDYYEGIESDLKMLKERYGLTYACHAYFPPPKEPFVVNLASCNSRIYEQSIEHYTQCIAMLKRMDCKVLSVHAGFMVEIGVDEIGHSLKSRTIYDEDEAYDRFCSAYENISEQCKANGIELFLENNVLSAENHTRFGYCNCLMMTDYASIMRMKEQLEFNLLLDLGHLHVSAKTLGLDFQTECEKLKEYARWIHLSENNGIFDEHKPLKADSEILKEFNRMYISGMNVTLETTGRINEILQSMQLVQSTGGKKDGNGNKGNDM